MCYNVSVEWLRLGRQEIVRSEMDAGSVDMSDFEWPVWREGPQQCPYLPGRTMECECTILTPLIGHAYQQFMDLGFRRSGETAYRPVCPGCRECVPVRVPVAAFRPSRSQRRVWRRNADVRVDTGVPHPTEEKWALFRRYLAYQHDGEMIREREDFERFLYHSPLKTLEMVYRVEGRLVGVGIVDVGESCLSSVYMYFDPDEAWRSLGVFSALMEIRTCELQGIPYWYLGYYVRDCDRMNYKALYRPHERLGVDGVWRR